MERRDVPAGGGEFFADAEFGLPGLREEGGYYSPGGVQRWQLTMPADTRLDSIAVDLPASPEADE